eukprot:TRINITY_DN11835_c0_g1_i1.p1 TRINITY_DN11835_c0_g1~~TRINITY_DN11835_c0_g1_i1.p1  ORF type:complete len:578 (+),score=99.51 TRINITY_DN11835_c0_g1_i1:142-1734(+)
MDSDGKDYKVNLFGFVYGTFPSAPGAFAFAVTYGVDVALIGGAVVLCNLLAAPLMFVTAKMAAISLTKRDVAQYYSVVHQAGTDAGYVSLAAALFLLVLLVMAKRYRDVRGQHLISFTIAALGFAIVGSTCQVDVPELQCHMRFSFAWYFIFSVRFWALLLALAELSKVLRYKWIQTLIGKPSLLVGWVLPAVFVGLFWTNAKHVDSGPYISCWYDTGESPFEISMGLLVAVLMALIACIVLRLQDRKMMQRTSTSSLATEHSNKTQLASLSDDASDDEMISIAAEDSPLLVKASKCSCADSELPIQTEDVEAARRDSNSIARTDDNHMCLRILSLLIFATVSSALGLANDSWRLTTTRTEGLYVELLFLDYVLIYSHGLVLFLCIGTDPQLYEPIAEAIQCASNRVRRYCYGTEVLEEEPTSPDDQLVLARTTYQDICGILKELRGSYVFHLRRYKDVVKGNELVTRLVSAGIALDRDDATRLGRALVARRALYHVTEEHHFHDHPYFYKVDENVLELVCGLNDPSHSR